MSRASGRSWPSGSSHTAISNGVFTNRAALQKVTGLGPKAFEQAAGFLRIRDGDNPLDASAIHPESYTVAGGAQARRTQPMPPRRPSVPRP